MKADANLNWENLARLYRFFFNAQKPPFKDNLKLRQAIQYAIDREAMAKAVGGGIGGANKYDLTEGTWVRSVRALLHLRPGEGAGADQGVGVTTPLPVRLPSSPARPISSKPRSFSRCSTRSASRSTSKGWSEWPGARRSASRTTSRWRPSRPARRSTDTISRAWAPDGRQRTSARAQIQDCLAKPHDLRRPEAPGDLREVRDPDVRDGLVGSMWIQPYNYLTKKNLKISSPFSEDWREWSMWFS